MLAKIHVCLWINKFHYPEKFTQMIGSLRIPMSLHCQKSQGFGNPSTFSATSYAPFGRGIMRLSTFIFKAFFHHVVCGINKKQDGVMSYRANYCNRTYYGMDNLYPYSLSSIEMNDCHTDMSYKSDKTLTLIHTHALC